MSGALQYELGFPTPETTQKLFDEMDFQRARAGLPVGLSRRVVRVHPAHGQAGPGHGLQRLGHCRQLRRPQVVWLTANDTTIYAFVNIDVSQGPVAIEIPPGAIVGLMDDFWQRSVTDVGLPGPDAGKGGTFLLLPPGYDGEVPSSGYYVTPGDDEQPQPPGPRHHRQQDEVPDAVERVRQDEGLPVERAREPQAEQVRLDLGQADRHDSPGRHRVLGATRRRSSTTTPCKSTTASSWRCSSRWASRRASRSSLTRGRRPSSRRPPRSAMRWHAT